MLTLTKNKAILAFCGGHFWLLLGGVSHHSTYILCTRLSGTVCLFLCFEMHTVPAWLILDHWSDDWVCVWLGRTGSVHSCSGSVTVIGLGLAAGTESGRSSPYYSQLDARSSTPTTIQAPKHFHVPGRPGLNIHLIGCYHHFHIHPAVIFEYKLKSH